MIFRKEVSIDKLLQFIKTKIEKGEPIELTKDQQELFLFQPEQMTISEFLEKITILLGEKK